MLKNSSDSGKSDSHVGKKIKIKAATPTMKELESHEQERQQEVKKKSATRRQKQLNKDADDKKSVQEYLNRDVYTSRRDMISGIKYRAQKNGLNLQNVSFVSPIGISESNYYDKSPEEHCKAIIKNIIENNEGSSSEKLEEFLKEIEGIKVMIPSASTNKTNSGNNDYTIDCASLQKENQLEKKRLEQERIEKERIEKERIEKERIEQERIEQERIEQERIEKERIEKERIEKERIEKERIENERIEKERIEKERIEKERIEKERIEKERIEKERIEKERIEKGRIEKERIEKERIEKERIEKERIEKERIEKARIEKENEKLEKEQEQERMNLPLFSQSSKKRKIYDDQLYDIRIDHVQSAPSGLDKQSDQIRKKSHAKIHSKIGASITIPRHQRYHDALGEMKNARINREIDKNASQHSQHYCQHCKSSVSHIPFAIQDVEYNIYKTSFINNNQELNGQPSLVWMSKMISLYTQSKNPSERLAIAKFYNDEIRQINKLCLNNEEKKEVLQNIDIAKSNPDYLAHYIDNMTDIKSFNNVLLFDFDTVVKIYTKTTTNRHSVDKKEKQDIISATNEIFGTTFQFQMQKQFERNAFCNIMQNVSVERTILLNSSHSNGLGA